MYIKYLNTAELILDIPAGWSTNQSRIDVGPKVVPMWRVVGLTPNPI